MALLYNYWKLKSFSLQHKLLNIYRSRYNRKIVLLSLPCTILRSTHLLSGFYYTFVTIYDINESLYDCKVLCQVYNIRRHITDNMYFTRFQVYILHTLNIANKFWIFVQRCVFFLYSTSLILVQRCKRETVITHLYIIRSAFCANVRK